MPRQGFAGPQQLLVKRSTMQRLTMQMRGYTFQLVTERDPFQLRILAHLAIPPPKAAHA